MTWELIDSIRGPVGPAGSIASADAESVEAGEPAAVIMSGTADTKHAHFKIPRGLPGVNAVANDAAMAALIAGTSTATRGALNTLFPILRVWNGTTYPARVAGATNLFIGPADPGLAMDPVADVWSNSDATTLAAVLAAVQNLASPLAIAVRATAGRNPVFIPASALGPVDNRAPTLSNFSPAANLSAGTPAWLFPAAATKVIGGTAQIPAGWGQVRVRTLWSHSVSSPSGNVQWLTRITPVLPSGSDVTVVTPGSTVTQTVPARYTTVSSLHADANASMPADGGLVRVNIARVGTGDTFTGDAALIGVWLEAV